ncbi:MAG: ABC transporter substrate-binding protein [Alphaproteobacteria bacterium]|nr:ABC transporter substrate-binding protein [Alphaproteobacteria bacterium]
MTRRLTRRNALAGLGAAAAAMTGLRPARGQVLDRVSFQTNWRAQAEHGGYYQAVAAGIYRRHGIDCDLRMGGPQINNAQLLLAGRVDAIMSNGFQALSYARENLPAICIGSIFQKDPQVLIAHPGVGHDSFEQMRGKPILIGAGGRVSYWPFLRARFGFTDEQIRPYTFNLQPFLADRNAIQQGFLTSEPYAIRRTGINPVVLLIADAGYDNYQTTIDVRRQFVDEKPDLVQRFVNATIEGWAGYLYGDPAAANALIKRDNPDMDDDKIAYAIQAMKDFGIVRSGDADRLGIGAMTDERWQRFYQQTAQWNLNPPNLDLSKAYTLRFVNQRIGMAG